MTRPERYPSTVALIGLEAGEAMQDDAKSAKRGDADITFVGSTWMPPGS